jgi:aspartyl-tRNA(Asn)/glutamyl-tRNA(Gln) amidotransferase subunit C
MVDKKIVEYVARLARIKISEEEKEFLSGQLSKILTYIDKLKQLNLDNVEPMRTPHPEQNVLRQDEAKISALAGDILENAPGRQDNYFKIPKVIE